MKLVKLATPWHHFARYSTRIAYSSNERLITLSFRTKDGLTTWWWSHSYSEFPGRGYRQYGPFQNKKEAAASADQFLIENGFTLIDDKLRGML